MKASVEMDDLLSDRIRRLAETCRQPIDRLILDAIEQHADRLEAKEEDIADFRKASKDGIDSGDASEIDFEALKAEGEAKARFLDEADASWEAYRKDGLHLTGDEVRDWLKGVGTDDEKPLPECHK